MSDSALSLQVPPQKPSSPEAHLQQLRSTSAASSASTVESTSATNPSITSVLRRDAARVLQGLFDQYSTTSSSPYSHPPSPTITHPTDLLVSKLQKSSRNSNAQADAGQPAMSDFSPNTLNNGAYTGSSFSYTPLPENYSSPEPEYDYAAAEEFINNFDWPNSDSDQSDPPTPPPIDFLGMGTPILSPALLAKVMAAMAEGKPLYMEHARKDKHKDKKQKSKRKSKDGGPDGEAGVGQRDPKEKRSHKKKLKDKLQSKKDLGVLGGAVPSMASSGLARAPSAAPSTSSNSTSQHRSNSKAFSAQNDKSGTKRRHSSAFRSESVETTSTSKRARQDRITSGASVNTSSSTDRASRPKCRKGWKGWVEIEVSTSEEEEDDQDDKTTGKMPSSSSKGKAKDNATSSHSMSNGSTSKPNIKRNKSVGTTEDGDSDSETEYPVSKKGWKGWALVESPPDTSKLIKLDYAPPILTTRATRSGRTFGDDEWDEKQLRNVSTMQSTSRRKSSAVSSRT